MTSDRSARQPDRWHTGWIVLPGDPLLAHRPNPDNLSELAQLDTDGYRPLRLPGASTAIRGTPE